MAKKDIRRYSQDDLKQMSARKGYTPTRKDAPEIELDEDFWKNARVVMPDEQGKSLVSLRVDRDVLAWFRTQGKGHLSRMNAVLRAFKAFGPKMDTLLRMQTAYEIAEAREREGKIKVKRYVAKQQPALVL